MPAILIRLALAVALIGLGVFLYLGWNRWNLRRLGRGQPGRMPGLEELRPGVPAVLYFTTPECVVCRTTQRPALQRLQAERRDNLQVIEVNAAERTSVADYWGVLSVPTTFVIDSHGQPRRVNHGLASKDKLMRQLDEAELEPPARPAARRDPAAVRVESRN